MSIFGDFIMFFTIFLGWRLAAGAFFWAKNDQNHFPPAGLLPQAPFFLVKNKILGEKKCFWFKKIIFCQKRYFLIHKYHFWIKKWRFFSHSLLFYSKNKHLGTSLLIPYRIVTSLYTTNIEFYQFFFNTFVLYG